MGTTKSIHGVMMTGEVNVISGGVGDMGYFSRGK